MKNTYTERLEKIIQDIKTELDASSIVVSLDEYQIWLECYKKITAWDELQRDDSSTNKYPSYPEIPCYTDIREIMKLAEAKQYPTWFIQPRFTGPHCILSFQNGEYKNMYSAQQNGMQVIERAGILGIPETVNDFTGNITGFILKDQSGGQSFLACDMDSKTGFLEKIKLLEQLGFSVVEHVLFPTEKIPTVPSHKLETSLRNYLSSALEKGLTVDGVVIVSDEGARVALEFH